MTSERNDGGAGEALGGVNERRLGGGSVRDASKLMMTGKFPKTIAKRPFMKNYKGAKSTTKKGKIMKTDSSQQGIGRFLCKRKKLIGDYCLDIGSGRQNSLGSSRNSYKNS